MIHIPFESDQILIRIHFFLNPTYNEKHNWFRFWILIILIIQKSELFKKNLIYVKYKDNIKI